MPFALPVWPPTFEIAGSNALDASSDPKRWIVVDGSIRRDVSEHDFRAELAACSRVEIARYANDDYVTHVCYRGKTRRGRPA